MKIAIITSGFLPVPAVNGGAVEGLINSLIDENEKKNHIEIEVLSIYDKKAYDESVKYKNTSFKFIKPKLIVRKIDDVIYWIVKNILKKENSHSYKFIVQRLYYLKKVSKELKDNEYDKVILENHPTQYLAMKWNKNYIKYENRYYYHCHNDINNTYGCNEIIKETRKFLCISNYIAENLCENYNYIAKNKISILKNCIDVDRFRKYINVDKVKEKYCIDPKRKIILYTGRLVEEKGILQLIRSLRFLKTTNYQLVIAGGVVSKIDFETPFIRKIHYECNEYKDNIIFTGYIEHENINELYKIADVVVLPSIWNEPAGLTMLEAMSSNSALITTNVGGIKEYIPDDAAIILENDENLVINIAKNIDLLLENKELNEKISSNGYKYSENYRLSKYYDEFFKILE